MVKKKANSAAFLSVFLLLFTEIIGVAFLDDEEQGVYGI